MNWMEPAPKLFPVALNIAVSVKYSRPEDLGRFHIIATAMGKGDGSVIISGVGEPDDVRLCGQSGKPLAAAHSGEMALGIGLLLAAEGAPGHILLARTLQLRTAGAGVKPTTAVGSMMADAGEGPHVVHGPNNAFATVENLF